MTALMLYQWKVSDKVYCVFRCSLKHALAVAFTISHQSPLPLFIF